MKENKSKRKKAKYENERMKIENQFNEHAKRQCS